MSTPDPKVTGSPENIWLIYGEIDTDTAHDECHEISWCDEPQDAADVRYVRGDVADRQAAEAEALRRERDELREQAAFAKQNLAVIGGMLGSPGPIEIDDIAARLHLLIAERDDQAARLAEIERQEPVALVLRSTMSRPVPWVVKHRRHLSVSASALVGSGADHLEPLYASPAPAAEPVLLSDEQVVDAYRQHFDVLMDHIYEYGTAAEGSEYYAIKMARAIEAAVLMANRMMPTATTKRPTRSVASANWAGQDRRRARGRAGEVDAARAQGTGAVKPNAMVRR